MEDNVKVLYDSQQEILQELESAKKRILRELSEVNKETLTRFREILTDYNKLLYNLDKRNVNFESVIREKIDTYTEDIDTLFADFNADIEQRLYDFKREVSSSVDSVVENSINDFLADSPLDDLQTDIDELQTGMTGIETDVSSAIAEIENINTSLTSILSSRSKMDVLFSGTASDDFTLTGDTNNYHFLICGAKLNTNTSVSIAVIPATQQGVKFQIADDGRFAVYSFAGNEMSKYTGQGTSATMVFVYGIKL